MSCQQRPKFDVFQKELFPPLASITNMVVKVTAIEEGSIYVKCLVSSSDTDCFWSSYAFSKKLKLTVKFYDNHRKLNDGKFINYNHVKSICRPFRILVQYSFATSEGQLDYYHQR